MKPFDILTSKFRDAGVVNLDPGFVYAPEFLAAQGRGDLNFIHYASWLKSRELTAAEDGSVRAEVKMLDAKLTPIVHGAGPGRCQDICLLASYMLAARGVHNVIVEGSAILKSSKGKYLGGHYVIDILDTGTSTGHFWLLVPPFTVVDFTIGNQRVTMPWNVPERIFLAESDVIPNYPVVREDLVAPRIMDSFTRPVEPYRSFANFIGVSEWAGSGRTLTYVPVEVSPPVIPVAEWKDYLNLKMSPAEYVRQYCENPV